VNSNLQALCLGSNLIWDDGAAALAEALKDNSSIHTLDLRRNYIEDEGAMAFAEALKINATLQELDLSNDRDDINISQSLLDLIDRLLSTYNLQKRRRLSDNWEA